MCEEAFVVYSNYKEKELDALALEDNLLGLAHLHYSSRVRLVA